MRMGSKVMARAGTRWLVAWSVAFLVGEAPCARASPVDPAVAPPGGRPSLAGTWQLNGALSDDADAKLSEAMRKNAPIERGGPGASGGGRPTGSGGGRGGGGRRGGAGASTGGGAMAIASGEEAITISEFLTTPARLQITETAGALALVGATGGAAPIDPSGRWMRGPDGRQFRARWKDGSLVTEVRSDGGPRSTTTYRLLAERRQLEVISRLDLAAGGSVLVRRVYDAAETEGHIA
jgi:hypothetical protein